LNRVVCPIAAPYLRTLKVAVSSVAGQILTLSLSRTDVSLFAVRALNFTVQDNDDISLDHVTLNLYDLY